MKKVLVEKRLRIFKETFPEWKVSEKSGNLYAAINTTSREVTKHLSATQVTKNTVSRLGEKRQWVEKSSDIIMITLRGKIMFKLKNDKYFKNLTVSMLDKHNRHDRMIALSDDKFNGLVRCFFTGRKYEWLKDYRNLWMFRYFTGFNSLKDAKVHLGFSFISDGDFVKLFNHTERYAIFDLMIKSSRSHDECVNCVSLIKDLVLKQKTKFSRPNRYSGFIELKDYFKMVRNMEGEYSIPGSCSALTKLHDEAVVKIQSQKIKSRSSKKMYYYSELFNLLDLKGLDYEVLDSEKSLHIEGLVQKHCISNYSDGLYGGNHLFIRFEHEGSFYDAQIGIDDWFTEINGKLLVQMKGKYNKEAPKTLKNTVLECINQCKGSDGKLEITVKTEQVGPLQYKSFTYEKEIELC